LFQDVVNKQINNQSPCGPHLAITPSFSLYKTCFKEEAMEKRNDLRIDSGNLEQSLVSLNFQQLEERLEVSPLLPGDGTETGDMELENCCTCKITPDPYKYERTLVAEEWPNS
jgi:hypothetical protein